MLVKKLFTPRLFLAIILTLFATVSSVNAGRTIVTIETNLGDITVELYKDEAPITVENFLNYVDKDFYDGIIFHRVIANFMAQTGAYDESLYDFDFSQYDEYNPFDIRDPNVFHEPDASIVDEATLSNVRGTLSMAKSGANTGNSQFFINFVDNTHLDADTATNGGHTVFGNVIDGMDIVDMMNGVDNIADPDDNENTEEYDHITGYFDDIPETPIVINHIYRVQDFDDSNSSNFDDIDFLKASNGGIRTFVGTGANQGDIWNYEFSEVDLLGVKCLKWHKDAQDTNIPDKSYYMTRDVEGKIFILKEVKDEDTDSEQILYEAEDLLDLRSIDYYAANDMYFKLIAGQYDESDINSDTNKIVLGSGGSTITEQIVEFDASLSPNYTNDDLFVVKYSRGLQGSETLIEYYYYHKDDGLVLYLQEEDQDTTGDGWWLDDKIFNSESTDFSDVPFLKLKNDYPFTRYFVAEGDRDQNFTTSIAYPSDKFNNVSYVQWIQNGIPEEGIKNFEIHLAKDTNDIVWVFYYESEFQVIFEADNLIEAVKLETFANENIQFALIAGAFNPDDLDDASNKILRVENTITINEKIVSFNETLSHIPLYQNELIKVKRWEGTDADEDDNNIWYYSADVGLVRNYRDEETGSEGNGWEVANFGGLFMDDSDDFTEVDFLKTAIDDEKHYYGSNDLEDDNYTYEFTDATVGGISIMKFVSSPDDSTDKTFEFQIGKDSNDIIWVLRYRIDGDNVFYAGSSNTAFLSARPLSDFASDNMHVKLITGDYDPTLPYDPNDPATDVNKIAYTLDSEQITEQIVSFNAALPDVPYYNDDLILVEYNNATDPNDTIRWKYYHPNDGLVREIYGAVNDPTNFTDINMHRLAWSSKAKPTFSDDSADFSDVNFIYAEPGDVKLMVGQGAYEGMNYLVQYKKTTYLDTICLQVLCDITHIEDFNTVESYYIARDATQDSLWILAHYVNEQPVFATTYLDQAVPFERWPDLRWQMCAETKEVDDSFSDGEITKTILAEEVEFSTRDDLDDEMILLKSSYDSETDPNIATAAYALMHVGEGVVLNLLDNFTDPNDLDPNYNNPDEIRLVDGDGFYQSHETALDELEIQVWASKNRDPGKIKDKIILTGEFDLTPSEFLGSPLTFIVGNWIATIDTTSDAFKEIGSDQSVFKYTGTIGDKGKIRLDLDLREDHDSFKLKATGIDLSGLIEPIEISMIANETIYQNPATLVGDLPVYQLKNTFDSLQAYSYHRKWTDKRINDKLTITGGITSVSPIDLTQIEELSISWGSSTSITPEGIDFKKSGNKNRYYLRKADGALRKLIIDWDKSYFKAYFVKDSLTAPSSSTALTISITDSDNNEVFNQSTTLQ